MYLNFIGSLLWNLRKKESIKMQDMNFKIGDELAKAYAY